MKRASSFWLIPCVICAMLAPTVQGGVIAQWKVADGGNDHYYELVELPDLIGWTDARNAATAATHLGASGHLVTVTSAAEDAFLQNAFQSFIGDPNTSVPGIYAWIGLSDSAQEGVYQWVTGEPFTYSNWAPNEPNNLGDEDYIWVWRRQFNGSPTWSWNDNSDRGPRGYFVEYDGPFTSPVPEPATLGLAVVGGVAVLAVRRRRIR